MFTNKTLQGIVRLGAMSAIGRKFQRSYMFWKFKRSFFNINLDQSNLIKAKLTHKKLSLLELEPRITPVITAVADNILVANNIETILYVLNNDTDTNGTGLQLSNLGSSYTAGDPNPVPIFPTIDGEGFVAK